MTRRMDQGRARVRKLSGSVLFTWDLEFVPQPRQPSAVTVEVSAMDERSAGSVECLGSGLPPLRSFDPAIGGFQIREVGEPSSPPTEAQVALMWSLIRKQLECRAGPGGFKR